MIGPRRDRKVRKYHLYACLAPRLATIVLLVTLLGTAAAEVCAAELNAAVPPGAPGSRAATALARTALEALEPALPVRQGAGRAWSDPNAAWLDERGFLPRRWDEGDGLRPEQWAELLTKLQAPYRLVPGPLSGGTDIQTLLNETQAVLERVASSVRPLALVTTVPGAQEVASVSVIWNWTPWPRLLIFEPQALELADGEELPDLLARIGTCAWRPRAYLSTDADTASGYYLGSAETRVRLLATDLGHAGQLVPAEQEQTMFAFKGDLLRGASVAALEFEGPGPSTWQVMRFLSKTRTNVGAFDLPYYLALP